MNETVEKIVNLGIGAVKTLNEQASDLYSKAGSKVNEFIATGEKSTDETSAKVRSFVDSALSSYKELEEKVLTFSKDATDRIKEFTPKKEEAAAAPAAGKKSKAAKA